MRLAALIFLLIVSSAISSEIQGPTTFPEHTIATVRLALDTSEGADRSVAWRTSSAAVNTVEAGLGQHVTAPPGEHSLYADVVTQTYTMMSVFVPDKDFPTDVTKAKPAVIKIPLTLSRETLTWKFTVVSVSTTTSPQTITPIATPTAATYVYEKDDGPVPAPVQAGINRLNREKKVIASVFEDDTKDGASDVPDQYKVPLAAAQKAGLPALIVTAGAVVVKVVKEPKTEQAVFEAVP